MATQTHYLTNSVHPDLAYRLMSTTDPGAEAFMTNNDGWVGGTGSTNRSKYATGVERASSTFDSTAYPDGVPDSTLLDCWYLNSGNFLRGVYAAGTWTLTVCVRAQTNTGCSGKAHGRLFIDANNSAGALIGGPYYEIGGGDQAGTTVTNLQTGTTQDSVITFTCGSVPMVTTFICIQIAWERTGGGGMTTSDIDLRIGNTSGHGSRITTPDFGVLPEDLSQQTLRPPRWHYR